MSIQKRSVLERELQNLITAVLQLSSMVYDAVDQAMNALHSRDVELAAHIMANDEEINRLRYMIEQDGLKVLATQQPLATDLRTVIAAIHVAGELERMGDHAAGIARLVKRLATEDEIVSFHKLPKMARRARDMIREAARAFADRDVARAEAMMKQDNKIDRQYRQLFEDTLVEMKEDEYIRRATYLLWVGHNLERIGDRAINIAERVIFMVTNRYVEDMIDFPSSPH